MLKRTVLDTGDLLEEFVEKKHQDQFEEHSEQEHNEKETTPEIIDGEVKEKDENQFEEDLLQEFDDIQDNYTKNLDDKQHNETHLTYDKVENPVEKKDQCQFEEHSEKEPSPEMMQEDENPLEDLSQEFDDFHDTEATAPYDTQNTETNLTNDKIENPCEEENIFESDVQMAKSVLPSDQPFECKISTVEGQFDDISDESQVEIGNNIAEESQPPVAAHPQQEDEDDIQTTWEKLPSPRKRSYPFNEAVGSSSTGNADSNFNMRTGGYSDPAAGCNVNMNHTGMTGCENPGRTNTTQRTFPTPNHADRFNRVQRSTSQITMNSTFNQRPTGEVTSIDSAEFKCGICNFTSAVYAEPSIHFETQHSFQMFLSCVL